jgi:hypothetical protein
MSDLDSLLSVQEHDTAADQLRHRRATLPERAQVDEGTAAIARLEAAIAEAEERVHAVRREQKRREDEVATLEARWQELDRTLYSGTVTSPKELQSLQEEQNVIKRRERHLEDEALDLMEQAEPLDADLAARTSEKEAAEELVRTALAALAEAEAGIEAELAVVIAERDVEAKAIPDGLLAEYDQIRARMGGIGAAKLQGVTCSGCNLALPAVVVDRIRKTGADDVVHCEECGRILVR